MWLKIAPIIITLIGVAIEAKKYFDSKNGKTYKGNRCVYSMISAEKCLNDINRRSNSAFGIIVVVYSIFAFEDILRLPIIKLEQPVILIGSLAIIVSAVVVKTILYNYTIFKDIKEFEKCIQENDISIKNLRGKGRIYWIIVVVIMITYIFIAYIINKEYIREWWILGFLIAIAGEAVYYSFAKSYFELRYICKAKKVEIKIMGMDSIITGIKDYQMNAHILSILCSDENGEMTQLIVPRDQIGYIRKTANENARIIDLVRAKQTNS